MRIGTFALFLFFVGLRTPQISAQPSPFLEKLGTEEGLSSNKINDMIQDPDGFLWIATTDGLNRFDGTEIVQFFHQPGRNSLPHNFIHCLELLPNGILAIGTQKGLGFYDRRKGTFRNFYPQQLTKLDEHNNIFRMLELDSKGDLWAVTNNSIFVFDTSLKLLRVIPSNFTEEDATKTRLQFVFKIIPLSTGEVLLYLKNGWHIFSPGSRFILPVERSAAAKRLGFLNQYARQGTYFPEAALFKLFNDHLLLIKPGIDSLFVYDEQGVIRSRSHFRFLDYPYISWSQEIRTIDSAQVSFLFHNYGLTMLRVKWVGGIPELDDPGNILLEDHEYISALSDRQKNLWLATAEEGLQKIDPAKQVFNFTLLPEKNTGHATKYDPVQFKRSETRLWVVTYGDGFFEIKPGSGMVHHRLTNTGDDLWANFCWNIQEVNKDLLWVATQSGMFWYRVSNGTSGRLQLRGKPTILDSVPVTTLFVDSRGLVWMGLGRGNGVCYYDPGKDRIIYDPPSHAKAYPLRYPVEIAEDRSGDVWFTSDASKHLVKWNRLTGSFSVIPLPDNAAAQTGDLNAIYLQDDSTFWLGSIACGLIRYNPITKTMKIFGREHGLGNSQISSILPDGNHRLWLTTASVLSVFDIPSGTFTNYSAREGLPVKSPTADLYYDTGAAQFYTGGPGGIFSFDPGKFNRSMAEQPMLITGMEVNGKAYSLLNSKEIKLEPGENNISIHYSSIDLTNGKQAKYAYRFVGDEMGWMTAGTQRQINFSSLNPGAYRFEVCTVNNDGSLGEQVASIDFRIKNPFTKTVWFYLLLISGAGGICFALYKFRQRQFRRTEEIRSEISRNLHDEVGANLTNISLSSLLAQKQLHQQDQVNTLLERIYEDSQTVSTAMREIVWSIDPAIDTIGEAIPRMIYYASELLEAKGISLTASIAPEVERLKLSMQERRDLYLVFKESVNNMARHSDSTEASVDFSLLQNKLVMTIADNGKGFDRSDPGISNGLKNMRKRAGIHNWDLQIVSAPLQGTMIILKTRIA